MDPYEACKQLEAVRDQQAEAIKALQAEVEHHAAVARGLTQGKLAEERLRKAVEAKAKALQAENERLGEERDELGIAASHWEERAEALQAEVRSLSNQLRLRSEDFYTEEGRAEAAEAKAERYRKALENLVSCYDSGSFEEQGLALDAARKELAAGEA